MKVTEEMVERTWIEWAGDELSTRETVAFVLRTALADVPEPETVADGYAQLLRDERARARELEAKLRRVEQLPGKWEARAIEQTKETQELFGPQSLVMSAVLEQLVRGVAAELRKALGLETAP